MTATSPESSPESSVPRSRLLVVDDELAVCLSCQRALQSEGCDVQFEQQPDAGLAAALGGQFDLILLDLMMPGLDGMQILRRLRDAGIASAVVIITGYATVESAVEAMKVGAADYVSKPFSPAQLRIVVARVLERSALLRENAALRRELEIHRGFEGMVGDSPAMKQVFALIARVAPTDGTVLITGESGTGKEMVVRAIHRLSRRRDQVLLACDCSALAPALLESELFGHVKGSFSGAIATKQGLFEAADKGTLFLDEVANLSPETQSKLLRVLESRRVRKVGDTAEREVDIRVVTATNRNLAEQVRDGSFREDLFYRFNVVPIYLPPLRARRSDIPRLAMVFLAEVCQRNQMAVRGFTPEAMEKLAGYHWPGNVRELRNIVERVAILVDADQIDVCHLPPEIHGALPGPTVPRLPHGWEAFKKLKQSVREAAVHELERRFLAEALARNQENVTRASEEVGMQRTQFHALMRKHGLTVAAEG